MSRTLLAALLLLGACDGEEPPPDPDAGFDAGIDAGPAPGRAPCDVDAGMAPRSSGGLTNECGEALVMAGFGLRFDEGARPLARYAVYPQLGDELTACAESASYRDALLVGRLAGGGADADGLLRASYFTVGVGMDRDPPDAGGPFPTVRVRRELLTLEMDEPEITVTRQFDLLSAGLADTPSVAVVLDGFELDTDQVQGLEFPSSVDPADGFPIARIGVQLGEVRRVGDEIELDITGRYVAGRTGDTIGDMAAEQVVVSLTVRYAVIALPNDPVYGTVSYREQHQPHGDEPASVCRPERETGALGISGPPAEHAMAALTGFDFQLFPDEDANEGVRVRELGARVLEHGYQAASGEASMRVEGYLSNEGEPAPRRNVDYRFEATVAHLSWDGPGDVSELRVVEPFTGGVASIVAPLTP